MRAAIAAVALGAGCAAEPPQRWEYVHAAILVPNCTTSACHSALSHPREIELHDRREAYRALTGRDCDDTTTPPGGLVDVASPEDSYLSILLRREGATGMPPNARLPDREIELIEAWMAGGAACD